MKNSKNQSWLITSPALVLGLSLLSACGTEIGNGRKPPVLPESDKAGNTSADPVASPDDSKSENAPDGDIVPLPSALEYLFIACGSPIPDLSAANFVESSTANNFTVTVPSSGSWTLTTPSETYSIQKNTNASSPNAIKSSTVTLGTQTCSKTTTVINGSETEKTIEFSDNYKTTWTIDGNAKVTNIKVLDPNGASVKVWNVQ